MLNGKLDEDKKLRVPEIHFAKFLIIVQQIKYGPNNLIVCINSLAKEMHKFQKSITSLHTPWQIHKVPISKLNAPPTEYKLLKKLG